MSICSVRGCSKPSTRYGPYCDTHKRALRRHGDAEQKGVTVAELAPYRKRVRQRIEKNPDSAAWDTLRKRWEVVVSEAGKQALAAEESGRPHVGFERRAQYEIAKVGREVEPMVVIETALALYLMQEDRPSRFRSDAAFEAQLARRVRGLTKTNAGSYWEHTTGKTKLVYRDLSPRVMSAVAQYIKAAFGVAGIYVARLEEQEREQDRKEREELFDALRSIK
jgi:hypothetical protein